jgi:hypothetical protein
MTSTDLMNIGAFANDLPDAAFAGLNPTEESLSDGIGSSYSIVGYKGKTWTLKKNGETYTFKRPDDGTDAPFLDVIILRSPSYKSKTWYEGGYVEGGSAGKRPDCASLHGVSPDREVAKPQAQACALCPRNEFKTGANGRMGKDCQDFKRLAVLILPAQTKLLLGEPLIEPVFLRIPPASLSDLGVLGDGMSRKGFHYSTYVTRIGFQQGLSHPKMTFQALHKLTAKEAPLIFEMREDPIAYRITGEREYGNPNVQAKSVAASNSMLIEQTAVQKNPSNGSGQPVGVVSEPAPVTAPLAAPAQEDEVTRLKRLLAEAQAKTVVVAAPSTPDHAATPASTTSQAGTAGESDPALDDLVANLLPR